MSTIETLKENYAAFKIDNPKMRIRDIATQLNVSEAELLFTALGEQATLLNTDFEELLKEAGSLGYVMALTRNDNCVHERKGEYKNVSFNNHVGVVLGPDIDLRLFMSNWAHGFAVDENDRQSLQFFDKNGGAVHKIYINEKSNAEAYQTLVQKYRSENQHGELITRTVKEIPAESPDHEIDIAAFKQAWQDMKDTHDFFGMLRKFKVSRMQGLRLAPQGMADEVGIARFKEVMEKCSAEKVDIMAFVGNDGCIQIHTGKVERLVQTGPWFNVLDPEFNLHLREDAIASVWLVKKPTTDGTIHSLEVFDSKGDMIVQFFGKRKPGIPESEAWRSALNAYEGAV